MTWFWGEGGRCCNLVPVGRRCYDLVPGGEGGCCDLVWGREGCVVTWSQGGK